MVTPFDHMILCPVLIGRGPHLDALDRLLVQARAEHGRVALFTGEAGIGKSRLAAEVKTRAAQQGFAVLQGHCFEPDRMLPYAPLLDLLRTRWAGRSVDEITADLGPCVDLVALLPEVAAMLPARPRASAPEPEIGSAQSELQ